MKKIVIYTLISFIFSVFASSCEDNKDNSLYYPDFTWDTGDGEDCWIAWISPNPAI